MRPPAQFGVGGAFQSYGIPQIGAIAGPYHLITISDNGDLDKLDETLAATQIAFLADLATRLDPIPAAQLRQGDPTLGYGGSGAGPNPSTPAACGPSGGAEETFIVTIGPGQTLTVRYYGRRHALHGVLVELNTNTGTLTDLHVELRRGGRVMARAAAGVVGTDRRRLVLRRRRARRFPAGRYTLIVRKGTGRVVARAVPVGKRQLATTLGPTAR